MAMIYILPDNKKTWFGYACLLALLTVITFGSLANHLFDAFDDQEHLHDAALILENPANIFSSKRVHPVRPTIDLTFVLALSAFGNNPAPYHVLLIALHALAAFLAARTFFALGADLEVSFVAGLLFLMNVAHFRAVHWITCLSYALGLIFSLITVLYFIQNTALYSMFIV